jgi:AcrR family transcriptional regulator
MNFIISDDKLNTKLPQVLRAAIHLFVQKGIDGTTIKEIAKAADVAEGALYRHFRSKDELAWHLFSAHLNQFTTDLMTKVLPVTGTRARVRIFIEESFKAYEEDPDLFTYLILREHSELEKFPKTATHPGHLVLKIIEDGQAAGEIRLGNIHVLGGLFIGGVIRMCVLRMYGNLKEDLGQHAPLVIEAVWDLLKAR